MFDLNPDVDHLMLDLDLADPFERDSAIRATLPSAAGRELGVADHRDASGPGLARRAAHALGTRLIALGSALTLDERTVRRPATR